MKKKFLILCMSVLLLTGCGGSEPISTGTGGGAANISESSSKSINGTYFRVINNHSIFLSNEIKIVIKDNNLDYFTNSSVFHYEIHREGDFVYTLKVSNDKLTCEDYGRDMVLYCFVNNGLLSAVIQEGDYSNYQIRKILFCTESYDLSRIN